MPYTLRILFFFTAGIVFPQIALAHSPIKGMGDFFNGILHPLFMPAHVLLLSALGLLYGQHNPVKIKPAIYLFLISVSAGLFASNVISLGSLSLVVLGSATFIALIVVIHIHIPLQALVFLGVLTGFIIGFDSLQDELSSKARILALFGSGVGVYLLLLYTMALSESFSQKTWKVIGVRVVASWIAASALMVLVLQFSTPVL